jgi:hypothetical protein
LNLTNPNFLQFDAPAQTTPALKEQVTLPSAMATDEELLKLLKEVTAPLHTL